MKYHGNYCGPNWSDGKHQLSVAFGQPAVDELDQLCKEHDAAYATSTDPVQLESADRTFALRALKLGWPKSIIAGIAVGAQAMHRAFDNYINQTTMSKKNTRRMTPVLLPQYPTMKTTIPKPSINRQQPKQRSIVASIPAAYTVTSHMQPAQSLSGKNGGVTLSHRGLVSSFFGSTNFGATNFQVNPALGSVFPWVSQLARSYDKYRFKSLKFEYRSVVPTTTPGVVMMSFDYDTLDTLPNTKFEHAQTTPNVESNAFNNFELQVKCDDTWRFCRQGPIVDGDLKTYDLGQLVVSSSYSTATLTGEIYVDYVVELAKPSHGVPISQRWGWTGAAAVPFSTLNTNAGTATAFIAGSTSAVRCVRPGEYYIHVFAQGAGMGAYNLPTIPGPTAGAIVGSVCPITVNAAGSVAQASIKVRMGATDVLNCANWFVGSTSLILFITEGEYIAMT